jgi:general secretion pathway protein C
MAPSTRTVSAPAAAPTALGERLAALSPREKKLLAVAAIMLVVTLLFLLIGSGGEEEGGGGVELAQAPPASLSPAPPPPSFAPPPPVAPAGPSVNSTDVSGLVLRGVLGGGPNGGAAILASADGGQRLVRVGRPVLPGVTLKEVGIRHALLSTPSGDMRLEFNKAAEFQASLAPAVAQMTAPPPGGEGRERETLQYRIGLEPRRQDGRISGFTIKPGAELPVLTRAGLRPGDVLVAVNGQPFESEEKVLELSSEIAGSYEVEFTFERAGKRLTTTAQINDRPKQ